MGVEAATVADATSAGQATAGLKPCASDDGEADGKAVKLMLAGVRPGRDRAQHVATVAPDNTMTASTQVKRASAMTTWWHSALAGLRGIHMLARANLGTQRPRGAGAQTEPM